MRYAGWKLKIPVPVRCVVLVFSMLICIPAVAAQSYDLQFCTFMGGGKWERVQSVFVDAAGYIYIAGSTKSANFPVTPGAYDTTGGGNNQNDGYVAKLAPDGSRIIWSTYLHGTSRDDVYGVYADDDGYVIVVGWTRSTNFPTTPGAYDRTHNGDMDVFVAKFVPDGTRLVYSTFLGGAGIDQCRGAIAFDSAGDIYLAGYTDSRNFPATPGAIQQTFQGGYGDAFVAKLSADASDLLFATYLGSSGPDHAFPGVCIHSDGSIITTGAAGAANFPATSGAYQTDFGGNAGHGVWNGDAFVARFSLTPDNNHILHYITFLGGSADEKSTAQHGLALDEDGNAVVAITTHSADLHTTPNAVQPNIKGGNNIYIAKISLDGSRLLAGTYFGGSVETGYEASGLAVDSNANIYITGSIFGAVTGHPTTPDAFETTPPGGNDAFFAVLSGDLTELTYSSFFGGSGNDRIRDLARDPCGRLIFAGDTYSTNLPITNGVLQTEYRGAGDTYIARFDPPTLQLADFNADKIIDHTDLAQLATRWLTSGPQCTDLNNDNHINIQDFTILADYWQEQY